MANEQIIRQASSPQLDVASFRGGNSGATRCLICLPGAYLSYALDFADRYLISERSVGFCGAPLLVGVSRFMPRSQSKWLIVGYTQSGQVCHP